MTIPENFPGIQRAIKKAKSTYALKVLALRKDGAGYSNASRIVLIVEDGRGICVTASVYSTFFHCMASITSYRRFVTM